MRIHNEEKNVTQLSTYTWRGKTYSTLRGLHNKVWKAHGQEAALSFDRDHMVVRIPRPLRGGYDEVHYPRTLDVQGNSTVAAEPSGTSSRLPVARSILRKAVRA
jgi:hypothetical protein